MFFRTLKEFSNSESGTITLDFVVLTAVVVSFGLTIASLATMGINPVTTSLNVILSPNGDFSAKFVQLDE